MTVLKKTLIACFAITLLFGACSKSKKEGVEPQGQTEGNTNNGNPEKLDTTLTVIQQLIENLRGGAIVEVQNENNDVVFGLKFTSSKKGKITTLRKYTGTTLTNIVKIWRYDSEQSKFIEYREQNVSTTTSTGFSDNVDVSDWDIEKDVTYMIGIRIIPPTTLSPTKVVRLSAIGEKNITNGNATIGPITFEKTFYYNTQSDNITTRLPEDIGDYKHFAGFLDFDFVEVQ